jgi:hypothetical protein
LAVFLLVGCRDESLNPNQPWEPGVHGWGVFDGVAEAGKANIADNSKTFPLTAQDKASIPFKIRWVSLDNKLTVNKIDIKVEMIESYTDSDGNPKTASLGSKVVKTITPAAGNRQWNPFTVTPAEVYNLFKDATVKYDKKTDVKVFANPARPRPANAWLAGAIKGANADVFKITWVLYTTDGLVFSTWNADSICLDPTPVSQANANCSLTFTVK